MIGYEKSDFYKSIPIMVEINYINPIMFHI